MIKIFFSAIIFFQFLVIKNLDPEWIGIQPKKTATKERGEKKFGVIPFCVATNFIKFTIILVLKCYRKKFGPIFKELYNFLP